MEFAEAQKLIIAVVERYCAKFNIPLDVNYAQLKLHEEVGEFSQAMVAYQGLARPSKRLDTETAKIALADELTDIIGMAMLNAHLLGIDLEETFARKWFSQLGEDLKNSGLNSEDSG